MAHRDLAGFKFKHPTSNGKIAPPTSKDKKVLFTQ